MAALQQLKFSLAGASLPRFSERRVGIDGDEIYLASFNLDRPPFAFSCGCLQVDECLSLLLSVKISRKRKINAKEKLLFLFNFDRF
jgi:hypothetical protein